MSMTLDQKVTTTAEASTTRWSGANDQPLPGTGATVRQVRVKAGHVAPKHSHPHEQFVLIVSGAGTLECHAGTIPLHPGTAIRFAPGAWHSAIFTADTVLTEVNLAA